MCKFSFTLISLLFISITAFNQDKIIKIDGDTLTVIVTETDLDYVKYQHLDEKSINSISLRIIDRIIFDSGREQVIDRPDKLKVVVGISNYKDVLVTENINDIKGLTKIANIFVETKGNNAGRLLTLERAQKKASMYGGNVLYITNAVGSYQSSTACPNGCYRITADVYNHYVHKKDEISNFILGDSLTRIYYNYYSTMGLFNVGSGLNLASNETYFFSENGQLLVDGSPSGTYKIEDNILHINLISYNKKGKATESEFYFKASIVTSMHIMLYYVDRSDTIHTVVFKK